MTTDRLPIDPAQADAMAIPTAAATVLRVMLNLSPYWVCALTIELNRSARYASDFRHVILERQDSVFIVLGLPSAARLQPRAHRDLPISDGGLLKVSP